jgi:hypothetical protein
MRGIRPRSWLMAATFIVGSAVSLAQTTTPQAQNQIPVAKKKTTHHKHATGRTHVVRMESGSTTAISPAAAAQDQQQRAADQRLLQQQQAQSANAQQVNDQQVQAAQKQFERAQKEQRIQDAPGPAQTGVVPAAGTPVAPANMDRRIQDAPGPAQTMPQPQQPAQPNPPQF